MMHYILAAVMCIITCLSIKAQVFELSFKDNNSPKPLILTMGFKPNATLGIDSMYGEMELPPFQPVGTGHAVLVMDLDKNSSYSSLIDLYGYKDLRSLEPIHKSDTFWIALSPWTQDRKEMEFNWNWPLEYGFDSVVITDKGGVGFRSTLNSSKSIIIKPNEFGVGPITIENYYVIIYRSNSLSSVTDIKPSFNEMYDVYNLQGSKVYSQYSYQEIIQLLNTVNTGLYLLKSSTQTLKVFNF